MDLHPQGIIKNDMVWLKGGPAYPERELGPVFADDASPFSRYEARFEIATNKVKALAEAIDGSDNKASYLMKLIHLREYLQRVDALGDYAPLFALLDSYEEELSTLISQNRAKNREIKLALLEEARAIEEEEDWKVAFEKLQEIQLKWLKTGSVEKAHIGQIEGDFAQLRSSFYERRNAFFESRKALMKDTISQYEALIKKMEELAASDLKRAVRPAKVLQQEWKALPDLPRKIRIELTGRWREQTSKIFGRDKPATKIEAGDSKGLEENLAERRQLLESLQNMDENLNENSLDDLVALKHKWQALPKINYKLYQELFDNFFMLNDLIREKVFLQKLADKKHRNFQQKSLSEQIKIKKELLKRLQLRDEQELDIFRENASRFVTTQNTVHDIMDKRLEAQQRKIEVKKQLMGQLQEMASHK